MRCEIFSKSSSHIRRNHVKAKYVKIILDVVEFNNAPNRILSGASHIITVIFTFAFGYGKYAVNDILRETLCEKIFYCYVSIFNRIM